MPRASWQGKKRKRARFSGTLLPRSTDLNNLLLPCHDTLYIEAATG